MCHSTFLAKVVRMNIMRRRLTQFKTSFMYVRRFFLICRGTISRTSLFRTFRRTRIKFTFFRWLFNLFNKTFSLSRIKGMNLVDLSNFFRPVWVVMYPNRVRLPTKSTSLSNTFRIFRNFYKFTNFRTACAMP